MSPYPPARWLAALPALIALAASAQTPPAPAPYRSALENYQPFGDDTPVPWKDANATVGKVGGWRAYAREASEKKVEAGPAPAASGAVHPHAGHGKPQGQQK